MNLKKILVACLLLTSMSLTGCEEVNVNHEFKNRCMMQMFEWYLPSDGNHWNYIKEQASELKASGINMVWLPPAYKGQSGADEVGYGVYDTYDLGEFDQKGTIRTKYGTKDEYLEAIHELHENDIGVLCDIVLNHRMGADDCEDTYAYMYDKDNRNVVITDENNNPLLVPIKSWTVFNFPGRNNQYSDFKWNETHFTGVDYDANNTYGGNRVFLFQNKSWDHEVDNEHGNYDYLMGADIDLNNPEVFNELVNWGKWYTKTTNLDGFRLDAVKHMCAPFYEEWIKAMREPIEMEDGSTIQKEMFTVGEYWSADLGKLQRYISDTHGAFSLFDVPLHMKLYEASNSNGNFDMGALFNDTLTKADSWHSVTFVDNHDTQPGQALGTYVNGWFKEIAYGIILLQEKGIPCIFYGDYYGIPHDGIEPVYNLKKLSSLRQSHAYGYERDYYDDCNIVGFTREGDSKDNGLALICTDNVGGSKWMEVGKSHANQTFVDALGHTNQKVIINEDGWGEFFVSDGSISVYIPE